MQDQSIIGRFAPTPSGRLHAGNIFAALMSWLICKSNNGKVVMRIEDLDQTRSKQEFIDACLSDFESLGLTWDGPIEFQSKNTSYYIEAFERLNRKGLTYPCFCTRSELLGANAPHGDSRQVYSGKCRTLTNAQLSNKYAEVSRASRMPAYRLKVDDICLSFIDLIQGYYSQCLTTDCGDYIIKRSDGGFAYNLASVIDDSRVGVNLIVRGIDLMPSTPGQIFLQKTLDLPKSSYAHIPLFCANDGRRLAKRNADSSIEELLCEFHTYEAILGHIAYTAGLIENDEAVSADDLLIDFKQNGITKIKTLWEGKSKIIFNPS